MDLASENKQKPITISVTNYQIKTLNVQKVDRTYSDHVLAGAVFRLTNSTGYSRDVTTDEKGIASFGDLLLGTYSLTGQSAKWLSTRSNGTCDYVILSDYANTDYGQQAKSLTILIRLP